MGFIVEHKRQSHRHVIRIEGYLSSSMLRNHRFSHFGFPNLLTAQYGHQLWLYMKFTLPNLLVFQFQNSRGGPGLVWLDSYQFTQSSQGQAMLRTHLACELNVLKSAAYVCSKQGCLGVSILSTKHSQVPMEGKGWGTDMQGPKLSVVTPRSFFN